MMPWCIRLSMATYANGGHPLRGVQNLDTMNVARITNIALHPLEESADLAQVIFGTDAVTAGHRSEGPGPQRAGERGQALAGFTS